MKNLLPRRARFGHWLAATLAAGASYCGWTHQNALAQMPVLPAAQSSPERGSEDTPAEVRAATTRGLTALDKAAASYSQHRKCFSCHHQTLPMFAQVMARTRGLAVDNDLLRAQLAFTLKTFERDLDDLRKGEGIGGKGMTVGYGLWAITLADCKPSETTEAMVAYLLKTQRSEGHWTGQMCRPPLEESYQTCTTLVVQGIQKYATDSQREEANAAIVKAKNWLLTAPAKSQEDRAAWLWGLHVLGCAPDELNAARAAILRTQREDGGWAQLDEMNSDAYATGQTLVLLQITGFDPNDPAYQRGVRFLLKSQRSDGAWLVVTRSKPLQPYYDFDDEDPLGKNQFISIPATSWAVAALAAGLAKPE